MAIMATKIFQLYYFVKNVNYKLHIFISKVAIFFFWVYFPCSMNPNRDGGGYLFIEAYYIYIYVCVFIFYLFGDLVFSLLDCLNKNKGKKK